MRRSKAFCFVCLLLAAWLGGSGTPHAPAAVVVLSNQTPETVAFLVTKVGGEPQTFRLASRGMVTIPTRQPLRLLLRDGERETPYEVEVDSACYFHRGESDRVILRKIDLGPAETSALASGNVSVAGDEITVVKVKVLVDEEERAAERIWTERLRKRVETASKIFERHFRVRFQVVETAMWRSDNQLSDLASLLREFERKIDPNPAQLAIGFSGQDAERRPSQHLGGTRGPLHPHILVREWFPGVSEAERLEILVHELGHYLGAAHSPGDQSVMRFSLGDQLARARDFEITFDPVNALAVHLVAEEVRFRKAAKQSDLSLQTRRQLARIYRVLGEAMPDDPAARDLAALMEGRANSRLREAVREVAAAIKEAAMARRELRGEEATNYLVRAAAAAAADLPEDTGPAAFVIALGLTLVDADLPLEMLLEARTDGGEGNSGSLAPKVSGQATIRGRRDLADHFFVSAYLTAVVGSRSAAAAGLAKELLDARGGSGFSFADLAADKAGSLFSLAVLKGSLRLEQLASTFSVHDFVPPVDQLEEGLRWETFAERYGGPTDERFLKHVAQIDQRILELPGYRDVGLRRTNGREGN